MPQDQLEKMTTETLQAELRRRQKGLQKLLRRRDKLRSELDQVEAELREHGGVMAGIASPGGTRRRPRNEANLADALAGILSETTMSVTDVAEEVQRRGYITTSPNFRTIVNQTLVKDPRFQRFARGFYVVKDSPAAKKVSGSTSGRKKTSKRAKSR
ncbi:MAG: hypothetical protein ACTS3F_06425 [Phycisphaerales bacterium]